MKQAKHVDVIQDTTAAEYARRAASRSIPRNEKSTTEIIMSSLSSSKNSGKFASKQASNSKR